jgi:hypothetical protein
MGVVSIVMNNARGHGKSKATAWEITGHDCTQTDFGKPTILTGRIIPRPTDSKVPVEPLHCTLAPGA